MSSPDLEFGELPSPVSSTTVLVRPRDRWWLHLLLLTGTFLTTSFMGARLAANFAQNVPAFQDDGTNALLRMLHHPRELLAGLPFSLTLLVILMAHEMGHYIACRYYRINASPPYFLPAPTLMGTFGAFIRIREPIFSRRALFDIGIAGPLAGFVFLVPALAIGVAYGKVLPEIATRGDVVFGVPLIEQFFRALLFPAVAQGDFYLHPIGRAAWLGVLATALNLLPLGQLDGGHICYALWGERCRWPWRLGVVGLLAMGWLSPTWLFWAAFLAIFALRHPRIYDPRPIGSGRVQLAIVSLLIFLLCFTPIPVDVP